ncbi:hypothetical protein FB451DRAFT_1185672 [Mycena latifolia]|nr:hypothetical protein FB451DRAFT_1185672 [Mycena latifolia]
MSSAAGYLIPRAARPASGASAQRRWVFDPPRPRSASPSIDVPEWKEKWSCQSFGPQQAQRRWVFGPCAHGQRHRQSTCPSGKKNDPASHSDLNRRSAAGYSTPAPTVGVTVNRRVRVEKTTALPAQRRWVFDPRAPTAGVTVNRRARVERKTALPAQRRWVFDPRAPTAGVTVNRRARVERKTALPVIRTSTGTVLLGIRPSRPRSVNRRAWVKEKPVLPVIQPD